MHCVEDELVKKKIQGHLWYRLFILTRNAKLRSKRGSTGLETRTAFGPRDCNIDAYAVAVVSYYY